MCGIAGILALEGGPPVDAESLRRMAAALEHRGPDDSGVWLSPDGRVGLANRRLSVTDLSPKARQPMTNEDGTLQVVYNGEIYNHRELRRELGEREHRWTTDHADTEVLLHGYERWGVHLVDHLRGMFAFALWDSRRRVLWLARDRLGIKPLYWCRLGQQILFASEIKALLVVPGVPRRLDENGLFDYLSFLTTPPPGTLFEGISKLEAASLVEIAPDGEMQPRRYWDPFDGVRKDYSRTDAEWGEEILATLRDSVACHSLADVRVGVFLSGGIDSSTTAALLTKPVGGDAVDTFCVGYGGTPGYDDEHEHAELVARRIGARHHQIDVTEADVVDFLPRMVRYQDEPIADPVCVPIYYLSRLARQHGITVCQVGEGADELFVGYDAWIMAVRLQQLNQLPVPRLAKRAGLEAMRLIGRVDRLAFEWLRRGVEDQLLFWGGAEAFLPGVKRDLLSARLKEQYKTRSSYETIRRLYDRFIRNAQEYSEIDWMTYCDLSFRLPELLLMRVDKMAMAASLEARVPFLDHHVVQLALSIPSARKVHGTELKRLLRLAVADIVPPEVLRRPKQGFGIPVAHWMRGRLGDMAQDVIRKFMGETDLLDRATVQRLLSTRDKRLWYLLNLAMWWDQVVRQAPEADVPSPTPSIEMVAHVPAPLGVGETAAGAATVPGNGHHPASSRNVVYHYGNLAGIPYFNAKALRLRGVAALSIKPYEFDNLGIAGRKHSNRQLPSHVTLTTSDNRFVRLAHRLRFFLGSLPDARLIHFYSNTVLPRVMDGLAYAAAHVPTAISWGGSDIRIISEARRSNPYFFLDPDEAHDAEIRSYLRQVSKHVRFVITDPEMAEYSRPYFEQTFIAKQPLDLATVEYRNVLDERKVPMLLHVPTSRDIKGTDRVVATVERLKREKIPIAFRLLEPELTQQQVKAEIAACDIYVDELRCGCYGMTAVEAMGCGKPSCTFIREDLVERFPADLPIVNVNPDTLYARLKELLLDPALRFDLGRRSRRYVETHHSLEAVGAQLLDAYRQMGVSID